MGTTTSSATYFDNTQVADVTAAVVGEWTSNSNDIVNCWNPIGSSMDAVDDPWESSWGTTGLSTAVIETPRVRSNMQRVEPVQLQDNCGARTGLGPMRFLNPRYRR